MLKSNDFLRYVLLGLEQFLKKEIEVLTNPVIVETATGGIEFEGAFDLVYEANLRLRTANRILMRIEQFTVKSYPELFDKISRIEWERYIGFSTGVCFDVTAKQSRLHHTDNIAKTVFEALEKKMSRAGVSVKAETDSSLCIFVRIVDDRCTVSIDSTGKYLYKRGYRTQTHEAPVRETTAAALLMACGFEQSAVIADPLCGSGTFIIEAAQMLHAIAPGKNRLFAFESWPSFKEAPYNHRKKQLLAGEHPSICKKLVAMDINAAAVGATGENGEKAGVLPDITVAQADALTFNNNRLLKAPGLVISNLPYGKRSGNRQDLLRFYGDFGKHLKKTCSGWRYGFLIPQESFFFKRLGLKSDSVVHFSNGGFPVQFIMGTI